MIDSGHNSKLREKKLYSKSRVFIAAFWASAWYFQQCGMCDQQSLWSACACAQTDQSLCESLEYSMIVKLLPEHHLEFLSLKGGCRGSPESTDVKMPYCWKSHAVAHFLTWPRVVIKGTLHFANIVWCFTTGNVVLDIRAVLSYRINILFAYCKGGNFNIHIWVCFDYFIC